MRIATTVALVMTHPWSRRLNGLILKLIELSEVLHQARNYRADRERHQNVDPKEMQLLKKDCQLESSHRQDRDC